MQKGERSAAAALKALDEIGAISLDKLVGSAQEVRNALAGHAFLEPGDICYPFIIRIGPRQDFDLVTVAEQMKQLGFELVREGR